MAEQKPAGPILDELGVTLDLDEQDRVSEVLVIAKITNLETGDVALALGSNDLDWVAQGGLVRAADEVTRGVPPQPRDDPDDD